MVVPMSSHTCEFVHSIPCPINRTYNPRYLSVLFLISLIVTETPPSFVPPLPAGAAALTASVADDDDGAAFFGGIVLVLSYLRSE